MAKIAITFAASTLAVAGGSHFDHIQTVARLGLGYDFSDAEMPADKKAEVMAAIEKATTKRGLNPRKLVAALSGGAAAQKYPASVVPGWAKTALKKENGLSEAEKAWVEANLVKGQVDDDEETAPAVAAG